MAFLSALDVNPVKRIDGFNDSTVIKNSIGKNLEYRGIFFFGRYISFYVVSEPLILKAIWEELNSLN